VIFISSQHLDLYQDFLIFRMMNFFHHASSPQATHRIFGNALKAAVLGTRSA
jgi:hypothetical protein